MRVYAVFLVLQSLNFVAILGMLKYVDTWKLEIISSHGSHKNTFFLRNLGIWG